MLVPFRSCSQLLKTFTARGSSNPYDITPAAPTGNGFAHLPNFFLQEVVGPFTVRMELYKLFDFLEVPSRYVGTERQFDANLPSPMPIFGMLPPYNTLSRFRAPGKVNLNTILDADMWTAVSGVYSNLVPYADFNASRRDANNQFTSPFRETIDAAVGVNGGLLRARNPTAPPSDALLIYDPISGQAPHNNSDRNAYFRYDGIQRLGNMVTTRSNVFAVWITVGYFEVDPATGDLLTNSPATCELGVDSGDITRHRGFFMIDRSVPVAFEQGVNHNVERSIMVQSYIE
jgi:hypothetical protein